MVMRHRAIVVSLVGLALLLSLLVVSSVSASPLTTKKERLRAVQAQLTQVHQRADVAVEAYNQANSRLATVRDDIDRNRRELARAREKLAAANEQLMVRARGIYMAPDVSLIDVVLASASFEELAAQVGLMKRVGDSDADLVAEAAAQRREVADRRAALAADEQAAEGLVARREDSKRQIVALQAQLEQTAGGLQGDIAELEAQEAAAARAAARAAADQEAEEAGARAAAQSAAGTGAAGASSSSGSGNSSSGGSSGGGGSSSGTGHASVASIVKRYLGVPYVWGGASPRGFDCSGLTMYCYAQVGVGLAHGATLQQQASKPVSLGSLRPGDLVFFGNASFSSHVGVYVGGGQMIHAPHTGAVVRYGPISGAWTGGRF